jgi:hypothetical protein
MAGCTSACGYCGRCTTGRESREEPYVEDIRRCDGCGTVMHWTDRGYRGPIRIVCLGEFCSDGCATEASEQHALALRSRPQPDTNPLLKEWK